MSLTDTETDTETDEADITTVLETLEAAVACFQRSDLDGLDAKAQLQLTRRLEVVRRRLDHGTDRCAGHLDRSGAYGIDGHRNARSALKHLGRLSGSEALGRVQTSRALRELPTVAAAYERGEIPTEHVRAIARVTTSPGVQEFLTVADPIFAEQAATETYDDFCAWLRRWESAADADGAAENAERNHARRNFAVLENFDGSWTSKGDHGRLQGSTMKQLLDRYEDAEFAADWAEAREEHGAEARVEHLRRTPAQRRADALFEIFRRAGASPADARSPEPLVNIVIDQETFEDELRRAAGETVEQDPNDIDGRRCQTLDGAELHPSDVVAAAFIGHVRRIVVDSASNVIDVGRKRRLFTGTGREAVLIQALLRNHAGLRCLWPGCDGRGGCLQADHREPAARGGPTDVGNSDPYCGSHNRIKERGFRPVREANGKWTIHRPGGDGPITPSV